MVKKQLKSLTFEGLAETYSVLHNVNKTLTLTATDWSDNAGTLQWHDASLSASFTNGTIFVSPDASNSDSYDEYLRCGVRCIHSEDGVIAFAANVQPTIDLIVNVTSLM